MKPATATIDDLRRSYGDLLRRVQPGGERIIITRRGRPIVALIPLSDLTRLEEQVSEDRAPYDASPPRANRGELTDLALFLADGDNVEAARLLAQAAADLLKDGDA